jgi:hypothetical protein
MQQSSLFIIQCIAFAILIFAVFYYFNKKTQYLMMAMESLQGQILEQQRILEGHDKLFRHLLGPSLYSSIPEIIPQPHAPQPQAVRPQPVHIQPPAPQPQSPQLQQPDLSNPIMNMAPMMNGILGVIGAMTTNNVGSPSFNVDPPSILPEIDENELKKELSKELAELDELDNKQEAIVEGRIEELVEES